MNKYQNKLTDLSYYGNIDLVIENNEEVQKIFEVLKDACEKAEKYDELKTAKKPIKHSRSFYRCINCNELFQNYHYQNCCPNCGQELDWGNEDEE